MGNIIIIIGIIIGVGVMIWQFLIVNVPDSDSADKSWRDDVDSADETIEESEEFLRRMERLSKRANKEGNDKKE